MKTLLYKLGQYLTTKYCPHINKIKVFEDWPERCLIEQCNDCKQKIYSDL